jgi:tRNA/rRNA methyltransferase
MTTHAMTSLSTADAASLARLARVRVVLVETSHPGNVGSAARALKTMGLTELVLVKPKLAAPQNDAQAIALASGATDVLTAARVVPDLATALVDVQLAVAFTARRRELSHEHVDVRTAAQRLMLELTAFASTSVALVFGNEAMCLSNEDVDQCQLIATVPANPNYSSLNLAQTVQVAAYEMMMATAAFVVSPQVLRQQAGVGEVEALLAHLEVAAIESGFLDPNLPKRFMTRMRRLLTRARLEPEEVAVLRGLVSAFQHPRSRQ